MGSSKKKNSKTSNTPHGNKQKLMDALKPISPDVLWVNDVIARLETSEFPESYVEIGGLARNIAYKLIDQKPELFETNKTNALKALLIECFDHIDLTIESTNSVEITAEKVFHSLQEESSKKPSKQR